MAGAICEHWRGLPRHVRPRTPSGCEECLKTGGAWRRLRLCISCGHVGCCDNSDGRHATSHHLATGHPIVRSHEKGETWFWCYIDAVFVVVPDWGP